MRGEELRKQQEQVRKLQQRSSTVRRIKRFQKLSRAVRQIFGCLIPIFLLVGVVSFSFQFREISENLGKAQQKIVEIKNITEIAMLRTITSNGTTFQQQQQECQITNLKHGDDLRSVELTYGMYFREMADNLQTCNEEQKQLQIELFDLETAKKDQTTTAFTFIKDFVLSNIGPKAKIRQDPTRTSTVYGFQKKYFKNLLFPQEVKRLFYFELSYLELTLFLKQSDAQFKDLEFVFSDQNWEKKWIFIEGNQGKITADFKYSHQIKAIGIVLINPDNGDEEKQIGSATGNCQISEFQLIGLVENKNKFVNHGEFEEMYLTPSLALEDSDYLKQDQDGLLTYYFLLEEQKI